MTKKLALLGGGEVASLLAALSAAPAFQQTKRLVEQPTARPQRIGPPKLSDKKLVRLLKAQKGKP